MKFPNVANQIVSGAYDINGNFFPLDSLDQTYFYNASEQVSSIVATDGSSTWTQTYTYTSVGGKILNISRWVKA